MEKRIPVTFMLHFPFPLSVWTRCLHTFKWPLWVAVLFLTGCATTAPPPLTVTDPVMASGISSPAAGLRIGPPTPVWPNSALRAVEPGSANAETVATLSATTDLWERIRRGFGMPDLHNEPVRNQEQWYAARPDYIGRMTERSRKYLFHIVEELERRNMPSELALLPFIESAFNPQAVSQAKAAGMWQFMPATGKDYDLKQNAFRDDRRDVLASTRAALDYLQMLHGMFNDWHLALAAYNWGQGSVKRAMERNEKKGLPTGYEDLTMPQETRMYVPKLQAVKNIVAQPQAFNAKLPTIENHPFFDTVRITRDMDVSLAVRLAEIDEADFRALNPSIHRPVILASGTPQILLPWDNASVFQRNLQFHLGPLATWTAWAVPSHMRTADIAKRVGMSEPELRNLNHIPPKMWVRAGSTLLVPRPSAQGNEVPGHLADNAHIQLQPEVVLKRSQVKARKGETLSAMAQRLGVEVSDLAQWNKLGATTALKAGQTLVAYTNATPVHASNGHKVTPSNAKPQRAQRAPASTKRSGATGKAPRKTTHTPTKKRKTHP
jgi:membrane-bound lytic murein transglycosylase D